MKRVLILGCAGAGKTTFSRQFAEKQSLPLTHLDAVFWAPNWQERKEEEFDKALNEILSHPSWVLDGQYQRTLPLRLTYADTVIFLDINRWICAFRVIKRWLFEKTPQALGCPQKIDWAFLKYILFQYPKRQRMKTLKLQEETSDSIHWVTLRSSREYQTFLNTLPK